MFVLKDTTFSSIPIEDLQGRSIYEKINSKIHLNYYGQTFPINNKLHNKNTFDYSLTPLIPEQQYADPDVEYSRLEVHSNTDEIDVIVTIPKKEMRAAEKVDASTYLMMKEHLLQQTMNYEQDKYANELMIGDKRLAMARQREDLDDQYKSAAANVGLSSIGTAIGSIAGILAAPVTGGLSLIGTAGALTRGAGAIKSGTEFLVKYPTLMKRVSEDERNMLMANTQQLYQRKQNYEHDFRFQTLKLNKMSGS